MGTAAGGPVSNLKEAAKSVRGTRGGSTEKVLSAKVGGVKARALVHKIPAICTFKLFLNSHFFTLNFLKTFITFHIRLTRIFKHRLIMLFRSPLIAKVRCP